MLHVDPYLSHQAGTRHSVHTGDGLPQSDGVFKRADLTLDFDLDADDAFADGLPLVQEFSQ